MNGTLNQAFDSVWGPIEREHGPTGREALLLVFMTGAAAAVDELRKGVEADGVAGAVMAMKGIEAELNRCFGKEVVQ